MMLAYQAQNSDHRPNFTRLHDQPAVRVKRVTVLAGGRHASPFDTRQIQVERGALADRAYDPNVATVLLNETMDVCEIHPCAVARPRTDVGDRELDIVTGLERGLRVYIVGRECLKKVPTVAIVPPFT